MIVKVVPMKSVKKSDFGALVRYLVDEQGKNERVGTVTVTNCESDEARAAILEALNTQVQNTRATSDKTFHLVVSFAPGEQPDEKTLRAMEDRICRGIGLGEHQRVSVVHHDTDILHVHIAINKIHPTRYTMHEPFNVFHTLGQLCDKLENEFGLEKTNHKAGKTLGENRAADMEQHAGVESLLGWIKRECAEHIDAAHMWATLHQVLREHGLEMRVRGNGLVITTEDGVAVKASSVGRNYSKRKLEARLGDFEPSPERPAGKKPARQYDKTPMPSRINTVELHARYKEVQRAESASRTTDWARAAVRQKRLIEDAKRRGRLKRAAIKLMNGAALVKKILYASTSATLRDEIASINKEYFKERQAVFEKYRRRTWADWLRAQAVAGDQEALAALRAREATQQGLKGNTVAGRSRPDTSGARFRQDSITKKGTIIYSAGSTAVRDDGDKLQVSRGADLAGLQVALLMAIERYGDQITVNGSGEFKEQIAMAAAAARLPIRFDNAGLEARRQQLMQTDRDKEQNYEQQGTTRERADRGRHAGRRFVSVDTEHGRNRGKEARHGTSTPSQSTSGHAKSNIGRIGQKPPPASQTVCEGCANSVWFSSPTELKCYCRVMYLITWNNREPNQITACDGTWLGQD